MLITIKHTKSHHVISLDGELDAVSTKDVRKIFGEILDNYNKDVVIDMSSISFIDSSGIGAIVFLYKRLKSTDRNLSLLGLTRQPKDMISLLRIDKTIQTYNCLDDFTSSHGSVEF